MVDLANTGKLEASNAKVVPVEYSPQEVVLAGGGKMSKVTVVEKNEASANTLFATFDAIAQSAIDLKKALVAKAADKDTSAADKLALSAAATKLALYSAAAGTAGAPVNTFVSVRAHLVAQVSNIGKIIAANDSAIRSAELALIGETNTAKRTDGKASIAAQKAARDAFGAFAFAHLEQKTATPFKTLSQLVKSSPVVVSDFVKVDAELAKLAVIAAPVSP